ncbi:MAG: ATP-binding protein [Marivita sp.]|nr:ATP-binding protein [Marivita sp.]
MDLSALDPALLQQARSYPGQILRSCRSLLRILDTMFTFVTWADREYRPELEQATASDLVDQVLSEFNEDVTEKKLQIATSLPHTLAFSTDPKMLVLALRQLIDNAIKFTPEGGQIMISGGLRGDTIVEIVVTDSGQGFAKETAEQAFNPFERLSYEASSTPGVGMGLSLARAAMQRINGRVLIDQSESGAKVRLELPASAWPPSIQ